MSQGISARALGLPSERRRGSETIRDHLCELYAKMPKVRGAVFSRQCTSPAVFENAPEQRDYEYVILRALPNTKGNGVRERRGRARRQFWTIYVCFTKKLRLAQLVKCLSHAVF